MEFSIITLLKENNFLVVVLTNTTLKELFVQCRWNAIWVAVFKYTCHIRWLLKENISKMHTTITDGVMTSHCSSKFTFQPHRADSRPDGEAMIVRLESPYLL